MNLTFLVRFLLFLLTLSAAAQNPAGHELVYLHGAESPSAPTALDAAGAMTFFAERGFRSGTPGTGNIVLGDTSALPGGLPGLRFESGYADYYRINQREDVAFYASRSGIGVTAAGGLFLQSEGTTYALAIDGANAPGGGRFKDLWLGHYNDPPALSSNGRVAFIAKTQGTGAPGRALYAAAIVAGSAVVTKIAGLSDPGPLGGTFTELYEDFKGGLGINDAGHIVFLGRTGSPDRVGNVFLWDGTALRSVSGDTFNAFALINNAGRIIYGQNNNLLLYRGPGLSPQVLASTTTATPAGGTFSVIDTPVLNEAGEIAFSSYVQSGPFGRGLWLWTREGVMKKIASPGPIAGGGTLTDMTLCDYARPTLDENGIVYFCARTSGGDRILKSDGTTTVPLISEGDQLEGRDVVALSIGDQESNAPRQSPVNDAGQLAYRAELENPDGEGLFRYTPPAFEAWRQQWYHRIADAGPAAALAAPLGDGIPNLIKFATGMDPAFRGGAPGQLTRNGAELTFTYPRNPAAVAEGFNFIVEWSDTLTPGSWSSAGVTSEALPGGPLEQVTATLPVSPQGRRFVRLRVTK